MFFKQSNNCTVNIFVKLILQCYTDLDNKLLFKANQKREVFFLKTGVYIFFF